MKRGNGVEVFLWIVVILGVVIGAFMAGYGACQSSQPDQKVIPACTEDEHVTQDFKCINDGLANYEGGYWVPVPPLEVSK